jgi:hypothetical protein
MISLVSMVVSCPLRDEWSDSNIRILVALRTFANIGIKGPLAAGFSNRILVQQNRPRRKAGAP